MFAKLFLLFLIVPFVEIILLMKMSGMIGFGWTVLLVVGTAALGANLARSQGFQIWFRLQKSLQAGEMPAQEIIEGVMVLIASALLLTPGLLTDFVGFLLLTPAFRLAITPSLKNYFAGRAAKGGRGFSVNINGQNPFQGFPQGRTDQKRKEEADYTIIEDDEPEK